MPALLFDPISLSEPHFTSCNASRNNSRLPSRNASFNDLESLANSAPMPWFNSPRKSGQASPTGLRTHTPPAILDTINRTEPLAPEWLSSDDALDPPPLPNSCTKPNSGRLARRRIIVPVAAVADNLEQTTIS